MANFLKKLIGNISINKKTKDTVGAVQEVGREGGNTGNETRDNAGIAGADSESLGKPDVFSREDAKAELERHIAEKLAQMSETDFDELFKLHEKQLKARKALERGTIGRNLPEMEGQISFMEISASGGRGLEGGGEEKRPDRTVEKVAAFVAVGAGAGNATVVPGREVEADGPKPVEAAMDVTGKARSVPGAKVTVTRGEKVAKFGPGEPATTAVENAKSVPDENGETAAAGKANAVPDEEISEGEPVEKAATFVSDEAVEENATIVPVELYSKDIESNESRYTDEAAAIVEAVELAGGTDTVEPDDMMAKFVPDETPSEDIESEHVGEAFGAYEVSEKTEDVELAGMSEQIVSNQFDAAVETGKHGETDEHITPTVPSVSIEVVELAELFAHIEAADGDELVETDAATDGALEYIESAEFAYIETASSSETTELTEAVEADEENASITPDGLYFEDIDSIESRHTDEAVELAGGTVVIEPGDETESEDVELAGMSEQTVSNQFDATVETGEADEPAEPGSGIPLSEKIEAGIIAFLRAAEAFNHNLKKSFRQAASACRRGASACAAAAAAVFKKAASKLPAYSDIFPPKPKSEQIKSRKARYVLLNYKRRFIKREKRIATRMAYFITHLDRRNDKLAEKTVKAVKKSNRHFHFVREWADLHKKKLLAGLFALVVFSVTAVSIVNYCTAYVYAYNGRTLGMVKNQDDVLHILGVVSEQLTREYGTNIEIDEDKDITFERVFAVDKEIDDMQEVLNRLTYMQDMNATAYALYIDDKRTAILDTQEGVDALLNDFKNIYLTASTGVTYESVTFAEKVDIKPIDTQLGKIQNPDDIIFKLQTGAIAQKIHVVQKGETFSGIAKMYGLKQSELEASNPGITPAKLSIAQEIILTQAVPLLTVQTVEVATYPDVIPYETVYEDNPQIFKGEETVKVTGVNGEREVTARITRNNGMEVGREELSSTVIKEASSAIVARGTKALPPLQGTGKFIYPVSGYRLTSKFGTRWGRMHNGIDMACRTGTRIGAADGGTVTFSGYKGSLGYVVIIDHGGNRETLYGHCSKLLVNRGDKVYQGQHIANVGNTGRSTGPHLHFEVHINGALKNPQNYL